jgi:PDZ and LIM domain protein 5/6/7
LKYQKPEKDVSFIKNSETYKMIHHLDKEPESGIEARPEKVVAEEDLRRILNANFHLHHENQLDN